MNGLLDRLRQGLGAVGEALRGNPLAGRIAAHFKPLAETDPDLPRQVARYVLEGDNASVLATLSAQPPRERWQRRSRFYPEQDEAGLFRDVAEWTVPQMRRLGEAIAALDPITTGWGHLGTMASPDWLRHVAPLWFATDRPLPPIATLLALAAETDAATPVALDILLCQSAADYRTVSADRYTGVADWLAEAQPEIAAAARALPADQRAELASLIGRTGRHDRYLDLLLDAATGPSKKTRAAARQALSGADSERLATALRAAFAQAAPGRRADLVEVAAAALGQASAPLLADWREAESAPKVTAALDRAAGAVTPASKPANSPWQVDGPSGYTAVDGSWVALPAPDPLPEPGPIPPEALRLLEPALAEFNRLLAEGKAEAAALKARWHWTHQQKPKDARDLGKIAVLAEAREPVDPQRAQSAVDWLRLHQLKHPAVAQFLDDPRLTLRHLVRLAVATSNGYLPALLGDWGGPIGAALRRRLAAGADLRSVVALWVEAGGRDPIGEHLASRWAQTIVEFDTPVWPLLCGYFARLDEALGLAPQSGAEQLRAPAALELLALLPKLPERYRGALMLLAGDSSARLRTAARDLLAGTPGLGAAIAVQLGDGRQEVRALAADWLASRSERDQAPAIRAALKKERSDVAKAAMITALGRLGEDIADYFEPAALLKEAEAGLAKAKPRGLDWLPFDRLPALRWRDGAPVDPLLPRWWVVLAAKLKQPGGNALMDLWLDRLLPEDAHRLGWMVLTGWIEEDTRTPTDEEADAYAAAHVDATLQQNIDYAKRWPQSADYFPTDRAIVFARLRNDKAGAYLGSAADSKGVLALATKVSGADAAQRIRGFLKDHGSRVSQAKALIDLLAAIGDPAALQLLLAAANRSKQRSVQAHAAALVEAIAERNGWSAAQLADRTVPTGGFDADGSQELECGEHRTYRLRLDAQDAVLILNAEGREVKALPAPRLEEERPAVEAAKKQLATAKKEVKQVLAAQADRLQEAMCLERRWDRAEWESFVAGHPIVGRLAARLVWQGIDADGVPGATFRPLGDGSYSDAADNDVDLAGFAAIRLAHSSLLDAETVAAWRGHLADYAVTPPFAQLGRDLPALDLSDAKARTIVDREGWMIESFKLRGAATKLGYQRGQAQDGGWFVTYEKGYRDAGLVAEIEFTGSPLPEENRQTALQSLGFRRLRAGGAGGQVPLGEVPPVLLAECWRDLHDIAAKGTGFDPDWKKSAWL